MQKPNKHYDDFFGHTIPRRSNLNIAGLKSNYGGKVKRRKLNGIMS